MRNRGSLGYVLVALALWRVAHVLSVWHSIDHPRQTATSLPDGSSSAMTDERPSGPMPFHVRTSHNGDMMSRHGSTESYGENWRDRAMRDRYADSSDDESDTDIAVPAPTLAPGKPMMNPTPSR